MKTGRNRLLIFSLTLVILVTTAYAGWLEVWKVAPTEVVEQGADTETSAPPQSTTTDSGETVITDSRVPLSERCSPVTRACLEAQPEWDPTTVSPAMRKIDPSDLTLFNDDLPYELESHPVNDLKHKHLTFVTVKTEDDPAYCEQYGVTVSEERGTRCAIYGPEAYTELAIVSTETNEVIHAYELINGYSLISTKEVTGMGVSGGWYGCCGKDGDSISTSLSLG